MEKQRVFTFSQVAQHRSKKDCWFIINGKVLDVTEFLEEHPGGEEVLMESAGKDSTKEFENIGHSKAAQNLLLKYQVGYLQGYNINIQEDHHDSAKDIAASNDTKPKGKEMTAFVIKVDSVPKYAICLEVFVPLLVAIFFFGYRYLTRAVVAAAAAQFSSNI